MAKKAWTPEERKAWGEKMKAARNKVVETKQVKVETPDTPETPTSQNVEQQQTLPPLQPETPQLEEQTDSELMARVKELESYIFRMAPQPNQGVQVGAGGVRGTITKFSVNPKDYPDPRDRLFEEKRLKLQNFNRNWWDLEWEVKAVNYETKDGLHVQEPKFQIKLIRIIEDPDTGEPSNRRYQLHKATFFEDPAAAIAVANQYGLELKEEMEKTFLDEMRYLRIRDWLLESFYAPKPQQAKKNEVEAVINNRLVKVYEANTEQAEPIPFERLSNR